MIAAVHWVPTRCRPLTHVISGALTTRMPGLGDTLDCQRAIQQFLPCGITLRHGPHLFESGQSQHSGTAAGCWGEGLVQEIAQQGYEEQTPERPNNDDRPAPPVRACPPLPSLC
ncbi:uncharacterized protein LOC132670041 [Panthera onca]